MTSKRPVTASDPEIGSVIGSYRLEREIGRGGMGVVYLASHTALKRSVALKLISSELAQDADFRARFIREARATASISHPNVRPVFDVGEIDDRLFMAMGYVEGADLGDLLEREGRLDPRRAAAIVVQIGAALDAAHALGLVHRDVKPSNVLLESGDRVYLTDFGLARHQTEREASLTASGKLIGSLDYIAPEQISGHPIDPRVDQYSLGCLLYRCLTGAPPFSADSGLAHLWAHLSAPRPLCSAIDPKLAPFDDVVLRALAVEPEERFPSAGELGRAALAAAGIDASLPSGESAREGAPDSRDHQRLALCEQFQYLHQPLSEQDEPVIPLLGTEDAVDALADHIAHSPGGAFLITGFRGVGKTTLINEALGRFQGREGEPPQLLRIALNVARPTATGELLFEVVRRLFEELVDTGILAQLDPAVQRELVLAYTRTSLSYKESRGNTVEQSRSLGLSPAVPLLESLGPKLELLKRTTDSLALEASFLAYSDADVEHDFQRIVTRLRDRPRPRPAPRPGLLERIGLRARRAEPAAPGWDGKVVVIVDELDKLTATTEPNGLESMASLLTGLKNLLTIPGVHFIFVAGPDLHDEWLKDRQRGSGLYDSVFGWQLYVPCLWSASDELLGAVLEPSGAEHPRRSALGEYLGFKARGMPRLLLMELNSFAAWRDGQPHIVLGDADLVRIEFYAELQRLLDRFLGPAHASHPFAVPIDEDRRRIGAYYVTDWILRTLGEPFTVDEIMRATDERALDPRLSLSKPQVCLLVIQLAKDGIVTQVQGGATETIQSDASRTQEAAYVLAPDVVVRLSAFARIDERERADLARAWDGGPAEGPRRLPELVAGGRYELVEEIDRVGLGRVYRALRHAGGGEAAVKILDAQNLAGDEQLRARFQRKASLAQGLSFDFIARIYETFEEDDGRLGIAMEFVHGTSLEQLFGSLTLRPDQAIGIASRLADALIHLDREGIVRLDLKPTKILLDSVLKPVIVDLGLAKALHEPADSSERLTMTGVVVGTPAYAAPEQLMGEAVDIRADMYSLALILYEMLAGRPARNAEDLMAALFQAAEEDVDVSSLQVSAELRAVLAKALARNPEDRHTSPTELRDALLAVPEASAGDEPAAVGA